MENKGMKLSEKIQRLLESNQTSYSINKYTGVPTGNIDLLRKGERKIKNLHLGVAERLGKYYDNNFKFLGEKDMTIKFIKDNPEEYTLEVDNDKYGKLLFDEDQNAWVLFPDDIYDGVTYFRSLDETKESIEDDLISAQV